MDQVRSDRWPHVYVHVPFCARRCSYCDFSIAVRSRVPTSEFVDAIMAEMVTRRLEIETGSLRSLYFGGGTPSKLGSDGIRALCSFLLKSEPGEKFSTITDVREVTIEANPEDVSADAAASWVAAGVNRVSLGVQSFHPKVLEWMHRTHSAGQAQQAVRTLRAAGVAEISVDLIFALPMELDRVWTDDLARVLDLQVDHLSLYGLTVEPSTPLGRWVARGEAAEAPEERFEAEFLAAHHQLTAAGFEHYEVSNYALPGRRARHNSAYWSGAPYLGLGPSAHGFDGRIRRWNRSGYTDWLRAVHAGADPMDGAESIGPASRVAEEVYLGLRTVDGLDVLQNELKMVTVWVNEGWAQWIPDEPSRRVRLTPAGWLRLDALATALTSVRSPS